MFSLFMLRCRTIQEHKHNTYIQHALTTTKVAVGKGDVTDYNCSIQSKSKLKYNRKVI